MRQIRGALAAGQIDQAANLCRRLDALRIPENAFAPGEDRPGRVFQDVHQAMARKASGVVQAGRHQPMPNAGSPSGRLRSVARSHPQHAGCRSASGDDSVAAQRAGRSAGSQAGDAARQSPGYSLFQQGEAALKARDHDRALQLFQQASAYCQRPGPGHRGQASGPPLAAFRAAGRAAAKRLLPGQPASPLDEAVAAQQALLKQVFADVNHREADARKMLEKDPKMALAMLQETRKKVESAGLEPASRDQLLRRLDRAIADTQHYIEQNRSRIELEAKNNAVRKDMIAEANMKLQTQQKLAELVDQYNRLIQEQRFEEAEVIAKRAQELAPHEMVTRLMVTKIKIMRKLDREQRIEDKKEEAFADAMIDVERGCHPARASPTSCPMPGTGRAMTGRRQQRALEMNRRHRSEKELEIEKKLLTPVNYSCRNRPLSEVLNQLAKLVNVNIHLDDEGLRQEGLSPDTPVTLELASDIQLKSYLNLILEKHHLCYIIKNEVLNITSETKKGDHVYQQVYAVGDLVMPIPNFVASPRMGLAGALHDAMTNAAGSQRRVRHDDDAHAVSPEMTPSRTAAPRSTRR